MTEEKDSLNNKSKNKGTKDLSCFLPEGRSLGDLPTELVEEQASIAFEDGFIIGKRFEVIEMLGFGGMGAVYKVKDLLMHGQIKALKTILPSLVSSAEARERFISEAQIAQSLRYEDGIVVVYDMGVGDKEDILFLTMELLEGQNLAEYIRLNNGNLGFVNACDIVLKLCDALDYAHHRKVIHRDIKPHNIFILPDGSVKLLDFGLAKLISPRVLARSNIGLGTAYYMSPEQSMGEEVDERSDIFALGAVFYQMLTGKVPMGRFKLPSELNNEIPQEIDSIIEICLNQQPDDRYGDVSTLSGDLDKIVAVEKGAMEEKREMEDELKRREAEEKRQEQERIRREAEERKQREARERQQREREDAYEEQRRERTREKKAKGTGKGPKLAIIIPVGVCAVIGIVVAIILSTGSGNKSTYVKDRSSSTSTYTKPTEIRREEKVNKPQAFKHEEPVGPYGTWHEHLMPGILTRVYHIPRDSDLIVRQLDDGLPIKLFLTLVDGTTKTVEIPPAVEGSPTVNMPDEYKSVQLLSQIETDVIVIVERR